MFTRMTIAILLSTTALAQGPEFETDMQSGEKPWTHLEFNNDVKNFQFVIVTDRTGGHRPGVFMTGIHRINLLQPEFVVSVGDLIEGYTTDAAVIDRQWREFNGFVEQLDMPFFYLPGNHDISNEAMIPEWTKRFGRPYYHFKYSNVLFLCLNSEDPPSSQLSPAQVEYARETLEQNRDVRWTIVLIHKPLWDYDGENGWSEVEAMLRGRPHNVYAGHRHRYQKHTRNDSDYIVMATMGGGSRLRGPNFGEFDHFMWVTMTDDGPIMANLLLDGVWDTDIINEERVRLLQPIAGGAAVKTDGIVVDTPVFREANTTLRLTNDANIPMSVNGRIRPNGQVRASVKRFSATVEPNSVKLLPLELTAVHPAAVRDLDPLRVSWTVRYDVEGDLNPLLVRGSHRIVIDSNFELLPVANDIAVDGLLSDWSGLDVRPTAPGQVESDGHAWNGDADASMDFSVRYSDSHLFVAVALVDDEIRLNRRRDYRRQDSTTIAIDLSGEAAESDEGVLEFHVIPGQDTAQLPDADDFPAGVHVVSTKTDSGYTVELQVPLDAIRAIQGDDWSTIRINIGMNDVDADGASQIWWRPRWNSPANYEGSGVFVRH